MVAGATLLDFIRLYLYKGIGTSTYDIHYFSWNLRCGCILETPFLQTFSVYYLGILCQLIPVKLLKLLTLLHAGVSGSRGSRWKHHHKPGSGHHF
jgi:hypothetical protein